MKKLLTLMLMLGMFLIPQITTYGYTINDLDIEIPELNNLTLREVFEDGNEVINYNFEDSLNNYVTIFSTVTLTNQILEINYDSDVGAGILTNILNIQNGDVVFFYSNVSATDDFRLHYTRNNLGNFSTVSTHSQSGYFEELYNIVTVSGINFSPRINLGNRSLNTGVAYVDGISGIYAINLTTLNLVSININRIYYYLKQYQQSYAYIKGYNQGNLDGYAEGLEDNTAYVQGYNVGYTDGLLGGTDMETGSSIIVLVLGIMAFALMLFGFASKRRIFNLFASGLFIALGGILFEYPAFIIVVVGLVIVNVYYTFVSD